MVAESAPAQSITLLHDHSVSSERTYKAVNLYLNEDSRKDLLGVPKTRAECKLQDNSLHLHNFYSCILQVEIQAFIM